MKNAITYILLGTGILSLGACASRSVLPDKAEVKTSREKPSGKCTDLGKVMGTSISRKGTREEVLEDLKQTAANKGANYVMVQQYSDTGTSVTGVAYSCE